MLRPVFRKDRTDCALQSRSQCDLGGCWGRSQLKRNECRRRATPTRSVRRSFMAHMPRTRNKQTTFMAMSTPRPKESETELQCCRRRGRPESGYTCLSAAQNFAPLNHPRATPLIGINLSFWCLTRAGESSESLERSRGPCENRLALKLD
jgi:hypothetical protein